MSLEENMDYDQVNDVLSRANQEFERRELEDLRAYEIEGELETGDEPTAEDLDRIEGDDDSGDNSLGEDNSTEGEPAAKPAPVVADDQGLSGAEAYMSFVAESSVGIATQCDISDDDALKAFEGVAGKLASEGVIPSMPDIESATSEEISLWTDKAKASDIVARAVEFVAGQ